MKSKIILRTYQDVLRAISAKENHLLLGNGFNNSLGVKTDYESIFKEMRKGYEGYGLLADGFKKSGYNLENLIGELEKMIEGKVGFLHKFVHNKVKLDFMKATSCIATSQVNAVYQEKNEGIYLLLKNFTNYFTLNYDPFLYLLLMRFRKDGNKNGESVAFQHTIQFQEADLDENQNSIYTKIKEARDNGQLSIQINKNNTKKNLSKCTKSEFSTVVKTHFKSENWSDKDITKAINLVWKEENRKEELDLNDGFFTEKDFEAPVYNHKQNLAQNLFFLHGGFHIYQDKRIIHKITQKSDQALYSRLEEIISNEKKDIVCVFSNSNKVDEIKKNPYLISAHKKLIALSGAMVLIGVSLAENDNHIFKKINDSKIETIYISSKESGRDHVYEKAKKIFTKKQIVLFDRETITYISPQL